MKNIALELFEEFTFTTDQVGQPSPWIIFWNVSFLTKKNMITVVIQFASFTRGLFITSHSSWRLLLSNGTFHPRLAETLVLQNYTFFYFLLDVPTCLSLLIYRQQHFIGTACAGFIISFFFLKALSVSYNEYSFIRIIIIPNNWHIYSNIRGARYRQKIGLWSGSTWAIIIKAQSSCFFTR